MARHHDPRDAMVSGTQTVMVTVSIPILFILGYGIAASLIVLGRFRGRPPFVGSGVILTGS